MQFNFLIATERSGSNLITKMMDAHPRVCGPAPLHILRVIGLEFFKYGDLSRPDTWDVFLKDMSAMSNSEFAKWNKTFAYEDLKAMAPVGDVPALCRAIYEEEARSLGKEILFIKELWTYRYFSFLHWCFPDAKYVFLVRDPRDMALSWRNNPSHPGGIVAGARQWAHDQKQTLPNFSALENVGRATLVRYEDLVQDSEAELSRLCDFLDIEYEPQMLEFHRNKLTQENAEKNPLWKNLNKEVMSDNTAKFVKELTAEEIAIIEVTCWRTLQFFGYKPHSDNALLKKINNQVITKLALEERQKYPPKGGEARVHDKVQNRLSRIIMRHPRYKEKQI